MTQVAAAQGAENPLGIDPEAPLDVVIFKGGYGDDYATNNNTIYNKLYPNSKITYAGTQRLQDKYQARFVDGNPPDVMDNSGAGAFNITTLVTEGQLTDLAPLMEAEAHGQPGVKFKDSLSAGTQDSGVYDGKQMNLNYVYNVSGIWYSGPLFEKNGWEYPTTWDEMLALCEKIKAAGIAPWTYQGLYPQYVATPFHQMIWKTGGWDAILKMDNLAEDAWTQPVVKQALEAWAGLHEKGYIMEGTEALSHTESQAAWLQGKAAFIPCGSWLANEMKDVTPEGFDMVVKAVPALTTSDVIPQTAIQSGAGENFIVPTGKNPKGGMEWLRLLFSKESAEFFAEHVQSLTAVKGAGEGKDFGSAFNSALAADNAAGANKFRGVQYPGWYADISEELQNQFGNLMTGKSSPDDVISAMSDIFKQVREDDSIKKFTATAPTPAASPEATPSS